MKLKKLMAVLVMVVMAVGMLAGCGTSNDSQDTSNNDNKATAANKTEDNTEESAAEEAENTTVPVGDGKTLVVYYSATGNTKDVAEKIANITEGDLFELEPTEPYTDDDLDWTNDDSRVSREHDDESLRDVELISTTVDNWDSYDTVYIGYPIWWGIAAWPVDNFVKDNDFTGKTVIPFCTASSSGIGDSGKLLEDMAGSGEWKDGERFHGGASETEISSWIDSLGL